MITSQEGSLARLSASAVGVISGVAVGRSTESRAIPTKSDTEVRTMPGSGDDAQNRPAPVGA
ncbi:MAG: hypothetical protein KF768_11265 [Phycisphaeraceae bacterium]|nr:hypothetical protein [Phycisphaeraceae bacterium]